LTKNFNYGLAQTFLENKALLKKQGFSFSEKEKVLC